MLRDGVAYQDLGSTHLDQRHRRRTIHRLIHRLNELGCEVPRLPPRRRLSFSVRSYGSRRGFEGSWAVRLVRRRQHVSDREGRRLPGQQYSGTCFNDKGKHSFKEKGNGSKCYPAGAAFSLSSLIETVNMVL
jgi:hypothetical protein